MKITGNEPAMPTEYGEYNSVGTLQKGLGLTKREYFAAMAMQGFCADSSYTVSNIAMTATKVADALIDELNKTEE